MQTDCVIQDTFWIPDPGEKSYAPKARTATDRYNGLRAGNLLKSNNQITMDSSTTVNQDHLKQYKFNFNPMDWGYIDSWQSDLIYTK